MDRCDILNVKNLFKRMKGDYIILRLLKIVLLLFNMYLLGMHVAIGKYEDLILVISLILIILSII